MSAPQNAVEFAELTVRVGLVEDNIARECIYEIDDRTAPAEAMARLMERKALITPLQTGRLVKGERDGYILGGFRLLYKIASGSFGRVYRGDDPRSGQVVAVKVLRKKWSDDKRKIELFEREGRLGLTMQHPNVVQILAVSKDQSTGQYYIVMEFIEGGNLRDILTIRKKLDVDESLRIMEECAAGLAYAHSRGLSHRDIKPTNILISTDKTARLVDFGLAEVTQQLTGGVTNFAEHKGPGGGKEDDEVDRTIDYAGLEKLTQQKKGDPRSDIYFLGTVLFEMLTGQSILPRTRDRNASASRVRYELDDQIFRLGGEYGLPRTVLQLVGRMCAFDPAQRYQTPALMHEAIKAVREELSAGGGGLRKATGATTIFVVEKHEKLQDVFRDKFKKLGLRVLMSIDAAQAVKKYQQSPYHALLIDAGTVGREGIDAYEKVLKEADTLHLDLTAILILNEDQEGYQSAIKARPGGEVMLRPVTMKQLTTTLKVRLGVSEVED